MSILEVSKAHMFDFYYNVIKLYFNEVKLLYTDTDSLTMEVRTNDLYNELKPIIELSKGSHNIQHQEQKNVRKV